MQEKKAKKNSWKIIQITIGLVIGALMISGSYSVNASTEPSPTQAHHLYIDGKFFATIDRKEVVEEIIAKKEEEFHKSKPGVKGSIVNELVYITEEVVNQSSRTTTTTSELAKQLDDTIVIKATVATIEIDHEPVLIFNNMTEAEEVLTQLKQSYADNEDITKLETLTASKLAEQLSVDETKISQITFDKDVQVKEIFIEPEEINTVDEATQYLKGETSNAKARDSKSTPPIQVQVEKITKKQEVIPFEEEIINDPKMLKGEERTVQKGKNGLREYVETTVEVNGKSVSTERSSEEILVSPKSKVTYRGTKVIPDRGTGSFVWPTNGGYISSFYGMRWGSMHKGIDIARPANRSIKAADNGRVRSAGWSSDGYGNRIIIDHQNGFVTLYAHLSSIDVSSGQIVQAGQVIGQMGSTGFSTGTHLHFEIHSNGKAVNPLDHLKR